MAVFTAKKYRPSSYGSSLPARYRAALAKHPFALFGLPFIATMVLGSFFLTPATALRYERHDRKVRQLTKEEELGIGKEKRRIDMREEYYVRPPTCCRFLAATAMKSLDRTVTDTKHRNWLLKIWITGSRSGLNDYLESQMVFYEWAFAT